MKNFLKIFLVLFLAIFAFLALPLNFLSGQEDPKEHEAKLKQIQEQLAEKKAQLSEIQQKEKNVLMDLLRSRNVLKQTQGELKYNQYRLVKTEQKVLSTKRELEENKEQLSDEWRDFRSRLRDIYKNSRSSYLEIIFGARDLSDFVSRSFYFEKIVAKDIELLNRMRKQQAVIGQKREQLEKETSQIRDLTGSIKLKENQLQLEVSQKHELHSSLQKMREEYERQIALLEESSKQIEALLRQRAGEVAEATGQMIWPVTGRISSGFGYRRHPIFRVIKFHTGIDIECPYGYPLKAADGGIVVDARYWGGYGNAVIIDHGAGTSTLYGHLSRFYVVAGQSVKKGQTLGLAGTTGYSTGPHVHFEVRRNGAPVNPMSWLP